MFLLLALSGCGKFFVPESNSGGGGSGSDSGNYLYVANESTGTVAGFSLGTSSMTNTANSPYSLGVAPSALAVTPDSKFLYVSSLAGAIYGYSIGSDGALTILNSGGSLVTGVSPVALAVDPSGQWLVAVEPASISASEAYVFGINSSTGLLTRQGNAVGLNTGSPDSIVFSPSESFAFISLGTGGVDVCPFSVSSGVLNSPTQLLKPKAAQDADQGLAVDPGSKYLFVTETGINAVRVLSIGASGALTAVSGSPFATGLGPSAVMVDSTGSYVYVANRTAGTISAFSMASTGVLTPIAGSPFTTGSEPAALAEDTLKTHIGVANAGGSPDVQVFTIGSSTSTTPGALTSFAKTTNGTNPTGAFAVAAAD